jgi:hypothetical protein
MTKFCLLSSVEILCIFYRKCPTLRLASVEIWTNQDCLGKVYLHHLFKRHDTYDLKIFVRMFEKLSGRLRNCQDVWETVRAFIVRTFEKGGVTVLNKSAGKISVIMVRFLFKTLADSKKWGNKCVTIYVSEIMQFCVPIITKHRKALEERQQQKVLN